MSIHIYIAMIGRIEFRAFLEDQIMNYLYLLNQTNTMKIIKKWGENVGVDIIEQIKKYGQECDKINKNNATTPYQFNTIPEELR